MRAFLLVIAVATGCGVHGIDKGTPAGNEMMVPTGSSPAAQPGAGPGGDDAAAGSTASTRDGGGATSRADSAASPTRPSDGGSSSGGSTGGGGAAGRGGAGGAGGATTPIAAGGPLPPININGTMVPGNKVIVFIHFGHSNMAGMGATPTSLRPLFYDTAPNIWTYQGGGKYVLAKEQTAPDPDEHGAGPGMAWLKTAAASLPPDYQLVSIARARGAAPSTDFMKGGLYYSTFMNRALELKGKVIFGGVFIMMGITDRHLPTDQQSGFTDRMTKIVADIRADLGLPNLPVLHTDYEVTALGALAVTGPVGTLIRPQILALPSRNANLAIIPTDMITLEDDHHFTMAGHKLWSERGIQIMKDRGWFPWK